MAWIRKYPLLTFILCCVVPVHGILWPLRISGVSPEALQPFKILFTFLPTVSAFLITMVTEGEEGTRTLWQRTFLKNGKVKFYPISLLTIVGLGVLALFVRSVVDGYVPPSYAYPDLGEALLLAPVLLLLPGFAEEYGWRGFLQERLQGRTGVFLASLVTGVVWGTWHGMDFLMGNWSAELNVVLLFFAYIIAVSIIVGAIYSASGGSIFIAMLAHFSANMVNSYLPIWTDAAVPETPIIFVGILWVLAFMILIFELTGRIRKEKLRA